MDPGILERVIANLIANALRYSPPGTPPALTGSMLRDRVELRDHRPRPRHTRRAPGSRCSCRSSGSGDTDNTTGVGLGLALSRGLTEAMGGTLEPEDTPGGGLTMTLSLPAVPGAGRPPSPAARSAKPRWPPGRTRHRGRRRALMPRHERRRMAPWSRDNGPGRRRRAADSPCAADQPAGAPVRRAHRRQRQPRRWRWPPSIRLTW